MSKSKKRTSIKTSKKTNGNGVGVRILCGVLALAVAAGATLAVLEYCTPYKPSQGFRPQEEQKPTEEAELPVFAGGLYITGTDGAGYDLLSAQIPVEAYAENGLVGYADNAYTITATVKPDNYATNTGVEWALSWTNAESEWATGKSVTDYVTATPSGDGYMESKIVNVTCAQAFGEQITLTASAKDKPEITASCTLDYVQRLEGKNVGLKFGDITCDFEGKKNPMFPSIPQTGTQDTKVPLQLSAYGTAAGGMPEVVITQPDAPYTIAGDYRYEYALLCNDDYFAYIQNARGAEYRFLFGTKTLVDSGRFEEGVFDTYLEEYDVANKGLYFGMKHIVENMPIYQLSNVMSNETLKRLTADNIQNYAEIITRWFNNKGTSDDETQTTYGTECVLFRLNMKVSSEYSNFTRSTKFTIGSIVNTTNSIDDIELNPPSTTI